MKLRTDLANPIQHVNIIRHIISDDGTFPNNGHLALIIYRNALHFGSSHDSKDVEQFLESNGWTNSWVNGVLDYHHYHSTTHEVLVVIDGSTRIQFGGPSGISLMVETGDVIIIPAGVAHKNLGGEEDFKCVGAYAEGRDYDMNYGKPEERPKTDENIKNVPLPASDPVFGMSGPLIKEWAAKPDDVQEVL
ncbi:MAG TPA: cupin domain-containing protein [Chryseosolibacter sp.]